MRKFIGLNTTQDARETVIVNLTNPIAATSANCQRFPKLKGIYFWYISGQGLRILMQKIGFNDAFAASMTFEDYTLIYLGTAGTRKTNDNQGHLRQRLEWHITTKHRASAISNGTLSTLRTTLGSILNKDLIEYMGINTESLLNQFMAEHLKVGLITYEGDVNDVIVAINDDERLLIDIFKPLLNLKSNSNKSVDGHPTNMVRLLRRAINTSTKNRLKCAI